MRLSYAFAVLMSLASVAQADSSRNQDVQVLKVYDGQSVGLTKDGSTMSGFNGLNYMDCKPQNATWEAIKASDKFMPVKLDCTDAFTAQRGLPTMRALVSNGFRTNKQDEEHYGPVAFSNSEGIFYVKVVELVVKESILSSSSFYGIGFYLNTFYYPYYQQPPAPGENNGNPYFIFADRVRQLAQTYPATTLKSGEKARVVKVLLPLEVATGGSSYVRGNYFRPFAEFIDQAGQKHQRWDEVASDYFVRWDTGFNREGDVLKQ